MKKQVNLGGKTYIWTGSEWLGEHYLRPPQVIIQQLAARYPQAGAVPARHPISTKDRASSTGADAILEELSAIMAAFIRQRSAETGDYVGRDEIAAALLANHRSRSLLENRYRKSGNGLEWHAANLVDWFSGRFTTGISEYLHDFERVKLDDKWAYKPAPPH